MKATILCALLALAPSKLCADSNTKSTLERVITIFAQLDSEWRLVSASDATPTELKRFEIELQKAAELFFEVAGTYQKTNPELSEAAGVTGNLLVDSAYVLFVGSEKRRAGRKILDEHAKKIAVLPNLYLGVLTSVAPSKAKEKGYLTQEEIEALREMPAKQFGEKIVGDKNINGDNAFARAASLTDGFLGALKE